MCGIAGCVTPAGGAPDRDALERMAAAMEHRGPDDRGIEVHGNVGLVHTRLAIVDPSPAGHQPMRGAAGRLVITYNGEVYNHADLRAQLPPVEWRSGSDTETLLHALETWGREAIGRCNGLFAYAYLDEQAQRLFLVRDRFGVKPLYYARHADCIWFASEVRTLLAAGVPRTVRRDVLQQFAQIGWAGGPQTPIEGIERLRPGALAEIDLRGLSIAERRWFRIEDQVDRDLAAELSRLSRSELVDRVEDALRTSVRRRLMSDVPLGTMCSGGLDSSLTTALAAQESGGAHNAFNASLIDRPEEDEGQWARRVVDHLGIELFTAPIDAERWRATLVRSVLHNDYPLTHESTGPMGEIAQVAREHGVKVLLSGEGADELFGGYPWRRQRAHALFDAGPLRRLRARLRGAGERRASLRAPRGGCASAGAFDDEVEDQAYAAYAHHRGPRRLVEAGLLSELSEYLPHLLNRQDKSTMQHSIETREPFLDPDLVRLAINLPLEARIRPRRKELLREVALRHLPREIIDRPKVGFGFDVRAYVNPYARPQFLDEGRMAEIFEIPREQMRQIVDEADSSGTLRLWSSEIWCRLFLDEASPETVERELWA